jgi:SAM-dependent methyltransferase
MAARVGVVYASLGAGCLYAISRPGHESYDIDTANQRWSTMNDEKILALSNRLPSAYNVGPASHLKTHSTLNEYLRYTIDADILACDPSVQLKSLKLDPATKSWIEGEGSAQWLLQTIGMAALMMFMPRYDAEAVMDIPATHLMSEEMWKEVLGHKRHRAIDVGAGSGHITRRFKALFDEVYAVEISRGVVWRLKQCGFTAIQSSNASRTVLKSEGLPENFDAVFALNVLDRVENSDEFLENLIEMMAPDGILIIALPLPYCAKPWVRGGDQTREQWADAHALSLEGENQSWEQAASSTITSLELAGLTVKRVVRAPYLCQQGFAMSANSEGPVHALDGAVFVAERKGPSSTNTRE